MKDPRSAISRGLGLLAELGKARISLLAALSAGMGFLLAGAAPSWRILLPAAGTWLLAMGSCSLNEIQERDSDARMERTRRRPLPSGRLKPEAALAAAAAELLLGSLLLLATGRLAAWTLGLFAVAWYNGLYTPLKHRTAFAVLPGSLIGALPPVIGWTSAGADAADPRILAVAAFFFLWQVPHFWLLLLKHGREYEEAGLPSVTALFTTPQLRRITFAWTAATAAASLLLPLVGAIRSLPLLVALAAGAFWLTIASGRRLVGAREAGSFGRVFRDINAFALLIILVASLDPFLTRHLPPLG